MPQSFRKDPDAKLDYSVNWSNWLVDGDHVVDATITVPPGLELVSTTVSGQSVIFWLRGGADGQVYRVVCHVVTAAGREDDRTVTFGMQEQ